MSKQDNFEEYLKIQNYEEEIKALEKKYGHPEGRLYIVFCDEELAGCIALRKLDNEKCEMKRLYINSKYRGNHIGNMLIERIIADAKEIGYKYMLLDTLPFLKTQFIVINNMVFMKFLVTITAQEKIQYI